MVSIILWQWMYKEDSTMRKLCAYYRGVELEFLSDDNALIAKCKHHLEEIGFDTTVINAGCGAPMIIVENHSTYNYIMNATKPRDVVDFYRIVLRELVDCYKNTEKNFTNLYKTGSI